MHDDDETPAAEEVAEVNRDPGLFRRVYERTTTKASSGDTPQLPRRSATFVVDHTICEPGTFDEDFELTIRSLSSAQELNAAREAKGDGTVMGLLLARTALYAVNGTPLKKIEKEAVWEYLGQGGRNLAAMMLGELVGVGKAAEGKAKATLQIH